MKWDQFEAVVRRMRACQTEYFKNRDHVVLREAKHLEGLVDEYLRDRLNGQQELPLGD